MNNCYTEFNSMSRNSSSTNVKQLVFASSAYDDQESHLSPAERESIKAQRETEQALLYHFESLPAGLVRIDFLRKNREVLELLKKNPDYSVTCPFIRAVCESSLGMINDRLFVKGDNAQLTMESTKLYVLFAQLTSTAYYLKFQHLSNELADALSVLKQDLSDDIAKQAVLDILEVMVRRVFQ